MLTCPRCSRVNPREAHFCHHDGVALAPPLDRPPPRLFVDPARAQLGPLRRGEDGRFELRLLNQGAGMVNGTVRCDEEPWLALNATGPALWKAHFEFAQECVIPVSVRGSALQANNRAYVATVRLESNGGSAEVPVVVAVPVMPFAEGVLAGAVSRRQLAEEALANPREAYALFASGAVARWYEANGWVYPCVGPVAPGKAALQQFFEALELTTPPVVGISATDLELEGRPGEVLRAEVNVFTRERKHVYAHATSEQGWVKIGPVTARGRCATVGLRVVVPPGGEPTQGRVQVTANGGRRFTVTVHLRVLGAESVGRNGDWRATPPPVRRSERDAH